MRYILPMSGRNYGEKTKTLVVQIEKGAKGRRTQEFGSEQTQPPEPLIATLLDRLA